MAQGYFVVAGENFLCTANGGIAVLAESLFAQLRLVEQVRLPVSSGVVVVDVAEQPLENYHWQSLRSQLGVIDESDFQLAGRALQTIRWHYDHQFCGRCGRATQAHASDLAKHCAHCALDFYPRLSPCIITLVTKGDYCLLAWHARSKTERYSCLAGFIEPGESSEQTLVREVMEEVGVVVDNIRYIASQPWPFPGQLMLGYFADYVSGDIAVDQQEILAAHWYKYDKLPNVPPPSTISGRLIQEFVQQRTSFHLTNP